MTGRRRFLQSLLAFASSFRPARGAEPPKPSTQAKPLDVIYVPTPDVVVDRMIEVAEIHDGDVLLDLGCGDGRIVVAAADRHKIHAIGVDIDPNRIEESRERARKYGVADNATFRLQDIFETDLDGASVITMYLIPNLIARLAPRLARLKPGSRIVSHSFPIRGAKPARVEKVELPGGGVRTVYLWVVPWEKS